jgi:uncharacterized protein (DUF2267 family)
MAERKTEKLTEAAEKTTAVLQGLQSRLSREAGARTAPPEVPDELGKQLEEYFAAATLPSAPPSVRLDDIRSRVMEGVVEKILRGWQEPGGRLSAAFKDALVERLIERVMDSLQNQKE